MSGVIEANFEAAIKAGKINGAILAQQLDDVLFLASATKLLATIAALKCVEDGLLSLTGDISNVAPELIEKQVNTGLAKDDETPILEPAARSTKLEMLLTHSAGTAYDFLHPLGDKWRKEFAPLEEGARKPVEELFAYTLAHHPGERWMYGSGLDWAGRIVERVTDKNAGQTLQRPNHVSSRHQWSFPCNVRISV